MSNNSRANGLPKPSAAQRAAQSARDKRLAGIRAGGAQSKRSNSNSRPQAQARGGRGSARSNAQAPIVGFFAPVSEGTIMKSVKPSFQRQAQNMQRIVHREKVVKLVTPNAGGAFAILQTLALNPGLAASFPWLSNEAQGWESYRFNRLRFIWVPSSGTAVAGNIIMGPDYDASDPAPLAETFLSSYTDCEEANVWSRFAADLEPALLNSTTRSRYVRSGPIPAGTDIKLYDAGNFFVASTDDAAANAGKLWVEYDITLFNPQTPGGGFPASTTASGQTALTAAAPFGTDPIIRGNIGMSIAGSLLTIQGALVGTVICITAHAAGTVMTAFSNTAVGATVRNHLAVNCVDAGAVSIVTMSTYVVTAQNPVITFALTATTVTSSQIVVTQLTPVPTF